LTGRLKRPAQAAFQLLLRHGGWPWLQAHRGHESQKGQSVWSSYSMRMPRWRRLTAYGVSGIFVAYRHLSALRFWSLFALRAFERRVCIAAAVKLVAEDLGERQADGESLRPPSLAVAK